MATKIGIDNYVGADARSLQFLNRVIRLGCTFLGRHRFRRCVALPGCTVVQTHIGSEVYVTSDPIEKEAHPPAVRREADTRLLLAERGVASRR
jgi:hypothetical protein